MQGSFLDFTVLFGICTKFMVYDHSKGRYPLWKLLDPPVVWLDHKKPARN